MLRFWVFVCVVLGAGSLAPTMSLAQDAPNLPQVCIDAKITTQADCEALLKKLGKGAHKPADKAKASTPKDSSSSAGPALPKVCTDAGITSQADCDAFQAAEKAKLKPSAPPPKPQMSTNAPASTPPAAPPSPPKAAVSLPKDCVAAGITTEAACAAFHASQNNTAKSLTSARPKTGAAVSGPAPVTSTSGQPAKPIVPTLSKDCLAAGLTTQAECDALHARQTAKPIVPTLPKDCLAAGLTTQAECDALHARQTAKLHPAPELKSNPGKPAAASQPTSVAPSAPASNKPGVTLPADCLAAGLKTQSDCDALHVMEKAKVKGRAPAIPASTAPASQPVTTTPASSASSVPSSQPATTTPVAPTLNGKQPTLAADCLAAGIKTPKDCDAYHLTKAKPAPSLPKTAPATAATPAQPSEVIPALPKGVTQAQVAPLLDSAKQSKTAAPPPHAVAPQAAPALAPPSTDKTAQAAIKLAAPPAIDTQPGTPVKPSGKAALTQLPSNATVVNQTIVNNITTTVVTNNNAGQPVAQPQPPPPPNPIGLSIGVVLQIGSGQLVVDSSGRDQYRIAERDRDHTRYEELSGGRYREIVERPDGTRVVTIYDRNGDVLRRSRFEPDGQEIVLAYYDYSNDPDLGQWRDPGEDLPPLQLRVPVQDYVLDADQADEGQIQLFFSRPPVEPLHRLYSISEVERSARLRDIVPRVELGDLTFDTGSADLGTDQIGALRGVANAMLALLQKNPAETFLIEGHTDAVGSDASNLVLSDARAASVAQILTEAYHIPPENLATQGYGAHFLKIQTDGPERLNRRVVIRRITPLITAESSQ